MGNKFKTFRQHFLTNLSDQRETRIHDYFLTAASEAGVPFEVHTLPSHCEDPDHQHKATILEFIAPPLLPNYYLYVQVPTDKVFTKVYIAQDWESSIDEARLNVFHLLSQKTAPKAAKSVIDEIELYWSLFRALTPEQQSEYED